MEYLQPYLYLLLMFVGVVLWANKFFSKRSAAYPYELTYDDLSKAARGATLRQAAWLFGAVLLFGVGTGATRQSSFWSGTCLLIQFVLATGGVLKGFGAVFNSQPKSLVDRLLAPLLGLGGFAVFVMTLALVPLAQ